MIFPLYLPKCLLVSSPVIYLNSGHAEVASLAWTSLMCTLDQVRQDLKPLSFRDEDRKGKLTGKNGGWSTSQPFEHLGGVTWQHVLNIQESRRLGFDSKESCFSCEKGGTR